MSRKGSKQAFAALHPDDRFGSNSEVEPGVDEVRYAAMTGPKREKVDVGQEMPAQCPTREVMGCRCHFRYIYC